MQSSRKANSLNSVRQQILRFMHEKSPSSEQLKKRTTINYLIAGIALSAGMSFAAVPLYRAFCQAYSYGGTTKGKKNLFRNVKFLNIVFSLIGHDGSSVEDMQKVPERVIKVTFNADLSASMLWNFKPQQHEIKVVPGETALAFYRAKNPTDRPVIGVSTYNVIPFEAGQYFNKIQCFCFEEQMLNPHEEVSSYRLLSSKNWLKLRLFCRSICLYSFILILSWLKTQKWS